MAAAGRERIGALSQRGRGPWRTRISSFSRMPRFTGKRGGRCSPVSPASGSRAQPGILPPGHPSYQSASPARSWATRPRRAPAPSAIPARHPRPAVSDCGLLLLVNTYDLGEVIPLLQAGATGCISRDSPVGDLARGIIAAGRGESVLPPALAGRARAPLPRGEPTGLPGAAESADLIEPLSDREAEVLRLLAQGLTNK